MSSNIKSELLREAEAGFVVTAPPDGLPLDSNRAAMWLSLHGIVYHSSFSMADGSASGFNADGAKAIFTLADLLLSHHPRLRVGTRKKSLAYAIANILRRHLQQPTASNSELNEAIVEAEVMDWFQAEATSREFLIPCSIIPDHASRFSIGPVKLYSIWDLASSNQKDATQLRDDIQYGPIVDMMERGHSRWIAEIQIDHCDQAVGSERADLAVDVALVAIQLVCCPSDT